MTVKLTEKAVEQSTYIILVSFTNEAGDPVVPKSVVWTLSDKNGVVINNRADVVIGSLAATVPIVLTGNDLIMSDNPLRHVLVESVYDSATYGNDLQLREEFSFSIENLKTLADF